MNTQTNEQTIGYKIARKIQEHLDLCGYFFDTPEFQYVAGLIDKELSSAPPQEKWEAREKGVWRRNDAGQLVVNWALDSEEAKAICDAHNASLSSAPQPTK